MGKEFKIDFSKIAIQHTFEGEKVLVDMRKQLGNKIHQTTGDIGFDDFARDIYFSNGEIVVPEEYVEPLKLVIKENFLAAVQRTFNDLLTIKE